MSNYNGEGYLGREYSYDKCSWQNIPEEIKVIGSKYAIICEELVECSIQLDLSDYKIAVGNSKNKSLCGYFRGRVDKACARLDEGADNGLHRNVQVVYYAKIKGAVYIR